MKHNPIQHSTLLAATEVVITAVECRQGSGPTQIAQILRVAEIASCEKRLLALETGDFATAMYENHQRRGTAADQARALIKRRESLMDSERLDFALSEEEAVAAFGNQALAAIALVVAMGPVKAAKHLERVLEALERAPKFSSDASAKRVFKRSEATMRGLRNAAILLLKVLHGIGSRRLNDKVWKPWQATPRTLAKFGGVEPPAPERADRLRFRNAAVACLQWIEAEIGTPGTAGFEHRCEMEAGILAGARSGSVFMLPTWEGVEVAPRRGSRFEAFRGCVALLSSYLIGMRRSGSADLLCGDILGPGEIDAHGNVGPCVVLRPGKTKYWRMETDIDGRNRTSAKAIPEDAYFAIYAPHLEYLRLVIGATPETPLFCTRDGAGLSDATMARVITDAGQLPGLPSVLPASHQARHAVGRHARYLARVADLEAMPIEYPAGISVDDMTEFLLDHEIKADKLGYLGMRDTSVRQTSSREIIKLAWLSLGPWGLPRSPDAELFEDAVRRQIAVADAIADVEAAIDHEESGESTRKVIERERRRRNELGICQELVDDVAAEISLTQLTGGADDVDVRRIRARFDSATSQRNDAHRLHVKAEEDMLARLRDSRERTAALRTELRQLDSELLRAKSDEKVARSWPAHAVRDEHAKSYDPVPAPDWDRIADGIRGATTEAAVYVPVRDFVTIAEIATYLGKDPDTIVTWERHARDGKAKGPFSAGTGGFDTSLGKKNRRIWTEDLASDWAATHESWLRQITAHWPATWPAKYQADEFAWKAKS
jgi:hypothetical protein